MNGRDLVLVDGVRTPMAEYNGSFAELSAIDLAAHTARALLDRLGVEGSEIDHVVVGNALHTSPDALYGARPVALEAGRPREGPALAVTPPRGAALPAVVSRAPLGVAGDAAPLPRGGMET